MPPPTRSTAAVRGLRNTMAAVFAVLAGLAFAAWLGLSWVQDHLLSTEGFARVTQPITQDSQFQSQVVQDVLRRLTDQPLEEFRTGFGPIDDWVRDRRNDAINGAGEWLSAPEQQGMWTEILTRTHAANVPQDVTSDPAPQDLVVDATPVAERVTEHVKSIVPIDPHLDASALRISVPATNTGPIMDGAVQLAEWRYPLPWLAGLSVIFGLLLSTRRWMVVALSAFFGLVFGLVELSMVTTAGRALVASSSADSIAELVVTRLVSVLSTSFMDAIVPWLVGAAVVCVTSVIAAVVSRRWLT